MIFIGAGASGIVPAISLTDVFGLAASRLMILERGETIGKSFRSWPEEMKFISPSFNQAGWTKSFDLNSVAYGSSPSYTLHAQHPSGHQYADYLDDLASMAGVRDQVQLRTEVLKVEPDPDYPGGVFNVQVRAGQDGTKVTTTYKTKYVVWAAGEFQYPREGTDCVGGAGSASTTRASNRGPSCRATSASSSAGMRVASTPHTIWRKRARRRRCSRRPPRGM